MTKSILDKTKADFKKKREMQEIMETKGAGDFCPYDGCKGKLGFISN